MASKTRDTRAVDAVPCPRCHARAGLQCYFKGASGPMGPHGPRVHAERRAAWQEWKRTQPLIAPLAAPPAVKRCTWCEEPILAAGELHRAFQEPMHMECGMRSVTGSVAHILRRCSCFVPGSKQEDPPAMTKREAAQAAFTLWSQIELWFGDKRI